MYTGCLLIIFNNWRKIGGVIHINKNRLRLPFGTTASQRRPLDLRFYFFFSNYYKGKRKKLRNRLAKLF